MTDTQLNPTTPMAFLPPDIAYGVTISIYIIIGSLGALIWDLLINLTNDHKLLFEHRIRLPTVIYFISRLSSLLYTLLSTVFGSAPIGHSRCAPVMLAMRISYPLAVSSTSLLFLVRVRAVFDRNPIITGFFFALWLSVVGGSLTIFPAISATSIGDTEYCMIVSVSPVAGAAGITALIFDTSVLLAISWRLLLNVYPMKEHTFRERLKTILFGKYLPAFTQALLQDGQKYYLVTVGSNFLITMMVYLPGVPITYGAMFSVSGVVLVNCMACYVFRKTIFGFKKPTISTITVSRDIAFCPIETTVGTGVDLSAAENATVQIK